jgi:hypothetical protein
MGQGILAFLSALARDERERIVKRAQEGCQGPRRSVWPQTQADPASTGRGPPAARDWGVGKINCPGF